MNKNETDSLPQSWISTTLGAVANIVGGGTPDTRDENNFSTTGIPWITPADLTGYTAKYIAHGSRFLTTKGISGSGARMLPAGTVLFSSRAPIGYVAIAANPVCTNQGFKSFVLPSSIEPEYVYYYLKSAKEIATALASGTTFLELSGAKAATIPIPIAPVNEQRRIVAEIEKQFSRLDAAVTALKRVQANLKRYRAAVLRAACEGRLVPTEAELARHEGRDYEPADVLLQRILSERRTRWEAEQLAKMEAQGRLPLNDTWKAKYQEPAWADISGLSDLPTGWNWARSEQLCDFITKGTTPSENDLFSGSGEIPFIKVYNLTHRGVLDFSINPSFVSKITHQKALGRSRVFPGDVLMNIVGPPLGKVSIVPTLYPEWNINQAVAVFRTMPSFNRQFLCYCLLTDNVLQWAVKRSKATAGQFNLTLEICRNLPIPLPPLVEQERIVTELERRLSIVEEVEATIAADLKRAERLRQAILQRAFSGKLVPQAPVDEPASILLERIRAEREGKQSVSAPTKRKGAKRASPEVYTPELF